MTRTSAHLALAFALTAFPLAQGQAPCIGWSLDNEIQPYGTDPNGIGVNGELVASFTVLDSTSSLGGVAIHRVLPDGTGVELVDSFAQTGLGPGFSAFTFGCAISSNGAVLLARKRPVPESVELVQFRDGGTVWAASSIFATSTSSAQKSRHFHSDGDTAAVAGIASGVGASRLIVDFLGVDPVSGDWYVEDTGRGPNVLFGYGIGDVHVRGDQAIVQVFGSRRAFAWKRTAPGQWSDVALPDAVVGCHSSGYQSHPQLGQAVPRPPAGRDLGSAKRSHLRFGQAVPPLARPSGPTAST